MSLRSPLWSAVPEETARVARAAFPKGNVYMRMHDALGPIYTNPDFAHLFPRDGQPAYDPALLALICVMQFAEGLSDSQAATAVRGRIDWKYALALALTDPGFDASVLSEFRTRLVDGQAEALLFETMLTLFRDQQLIKVRGRQRTDSTHILAAIHVLNRLECVGETLRHALNTLATVAPDWLQSWVPASWFDRYGHRVEEYRLPPGKPERYAMAAVIGTDGRQLLDRVFAPTTPSWLREIPAIQILRRVWIQEFYAVAPDQPMRWRTAEDLPCGPLLINSPYDPDAHWSKKRDTEWVGYKVHITETADADTPNLITDVTTTVATTNDAAVLPVIQAQLVRRDVPPGEQLVDQGYTSTDHLLTSRAEHGIDLIGPLPADKSWQALADAGFGASQFVLDWEAEVATCPHGKQRKAWAEREDRDGRKTVQISFRTADCQGCPLRADCTKNKRQGRTLMVHQRDHYAALQAARMRQKTAQFKEQYAARAGIEGTLSQGVRICDLRRSRYRGLAKTRLVHFLIAAAMNFLRVAAWFAEKPRAQTRRSVFATLAPAAI